MSDERWICVHNKCCDRNRFACIFILLLNWNTPFFIILSLFLFYISYLCFAIFFSLPFAFSIFWRWIAKRVNYSCLSSIARSQLLLLFFFGLMTLLMLFRISLYSLYSSAHFTAQWNSLFADGHKWAHVPKTSVFTYIRPQLPYGVS